MGITRQYLSYVPLSNFNIICNTDCNIIFVTLNDISDRFVAVGACENVIIWDLRLGKLVKTIENEYMKNNTSKKNIVVKLATYYKSKQIAVGYSDGMVNTFNLANGDLIGTFQGHNSAITALNFDIIGQMLATGSKDTDAVIWDIISEKGLYRLTDHNAVITDVQFMTKHNIVLTSSKDTYIKFWDLTTGHCFKTLANHVTEVWCLSTLQDFVISGSNDAALQTWKIEKCNDEDSDIKMLELLSSNTPTNFSSSIKCNKMDSLIREGHGRVFSMSTDNSASIVCCHGHNKLLDLFIFNEDELVFKRFRNRQRKLRKKVSKYGENCVDSKLINSDVPALQDIVQRLPSIITDFKINSAAVFRSENNLKVILSLENNSLALYNISLTEKKEVKLMRNIALHGHRSNVKALSFSTDNLAIFTAGAESVKMWNRKSLDCIRTVTTPNFVQCLCVVSGDRHILTGLKNGLLLIIDIIASEVVETISAHKSDIKSIYMLTDELTCITSGDQTVKFWKLELITLPNSNKKTLSLLHFKSLELDENILYAKVSPDNKLLAVALIDNTVKMFFTDTFKHFVDLYGHTLPVIEFDISYDSSLIITASADKTIRIWGLDYGDCHKHLTTNSSLTSIKFIPKTHQFITSDKNGNITHWDGDIFEKILTLQGHRGECFNLAISENGCFIISSGQDNVIRLFEKSNEPVVLEDEQENEELVTEDINVYGGPSVLSLPTKKSISSEKSAELLLECLNVIKEYNDSLIEYENKGLEKPKLPIIMSAFNVKTTDDYLLEMIKRIRPSDLEGVLLLMPFSTICYFLELIIPLLNNMHHDVEIVVRSLIFLVQTLHKPISSAKDMMPILRKLNILATKRTNEYKDLIGENLHSLLFINNSQEEDELVFNIQQTEGKKRKRRQQRILKSAVVNI